MANLLHPGRHNDGEPATVNNGFVPPRDFVLNRVARPVFFTAKTEDAVVGK